MVHGKKIKSESWIAVAQFTAAGILNFLGPLWPGQTTGLAYDNSHSYQNITRELFRHGFRT